MWDITINAKRFGNGKGLIVVTRKVMITTRWLSVEDRRTIIATG